MTFPICCSSLSSLAVRTDPPDELAKGRTEQSFILIIQWNFGSCSDLRTLCESFSHLTSHCAHHSSTSSRTREGNSSELREEKWCIQNQAISTYERREERKRKRVHGKEASSRKCYLANRQCLRESSSSLSLICMFLVLLILQGDTDKINFIGKCPSQPQVKTAFRMSLLFSSRRMGSEHANVIVH